MILPLPKGAKRVAPQAQPPPRSFWKRKYHSAEGEGFEPSVPDEGYNAFRERPVRPLRHPSVMREFYQIAIVLKMITRLF